MFYLNLGFIVCLTLVLSILSNFSFLSTGHSFSRTTEKLLCSFFSKIALRDFSVIGLYSILVNSAHSTDWLTPFPFIVVRKDPY